MAIEDLPLVRGCRWWGSITVGRRGTRRAQLRLTCYRRYCGRGPASGVRWEGVRTRGTEHDMAPAAKFEPLQKRPSEATSAVRAATTEPREQVWQRIDQAQVDVNVALTDANQQAGQAANRAPSKWAQLKADAAAKREDVKAKIDKRAEQ